MKIALFISSLEAGGAERALSELANYWSGKDHEVHLFLFVGANVPLFYDLNSRIRCHYLDVMTPDNCGFLKRYFYLLKRVRSLRQTLKKTSPDFILSFMDVINVQVILASLGLGKRPHVCERNNPFLRRLSLLYTFLRKIVYPKARVIVQTYGAQKYFSFMKKEKPLVIPNTLRALPAIKGEKRQKGRIICVGRLVHQKGFDLLINSFATLQDKFPDYYIEIYGEGPERQNLEKLITDKGLEKRVTLKGISSRIEDILQEGHVFVFPSRFEGFPNALAEALAMELPCLASDTIGCSDLIQHGENGLLFKTGDGDSLTEALRILLSDEVLQKKLSQQAVLVRERLAPDVIYPRWDALLSETTTTKFL